MSDETAPLILVPATDPTPMPDVPLELSEGQKHRVGITGPKSPTREQPLAHLAARDGSSGVQSVSAPEKPLALADMLAAIGLLGWSNPEMVRRSIRRAHPPPPPRKCNLPGCDKTHEGRRAK